MKVRVLRQAVMWATTIGLLTGSRGGAQAQLAGTAQKGGENARSVLRIWGAGAEGQSQSASSLPRVLTKLETDYRREHPEVSFAHHLSGNDSALGGLYVGAADLALMDREPSYIELDGYQQVIKGQKPYEVALMRGGTLSGGHSSPLVVVVNVDNPLARLTLDELDRVFDAKRQSTSHQVTTWGDLGLGAGWTDQRLHLYGLETGGAEAAIFSKVVMAGNQRWVCWYQEMKENGGSGNAARSVAEAVARDPYALGLTTLDAVTVRTKVLAITDTTGTARLPTADGLTSGEYPLGRTLLMLTRAEKNGQPEDKVRGFLEYLLGPRGQAIIASDSAYVPLSKKEIEHEREALR